ncbi:MAG: sigma-70 family RNA polymerase sigma factor [Clostridium sp.]|uniref:RNA polymerase sigma factor n=1 Tax=Clostridium sp. TaxID=1506 RepID=UPI002A89F2AF|nr:sigma-70 family RNA polymerase sigma factor [Clostridium sp.]MDY5097578.1 sigma-70 family RNA polymerase sigma factor [Clostridium sp.]
MDEDLKLIKEVLKGNVDSFSILMNKYEHMVFSFAYNMINDREAAQDVTQEVFITIYNKLYMYEKKYKFKNWTLKITRNKAIDYMRKYKRVYEANIEDITYIYDNNPGPEEAMEIREAKLMIKEFISKLGDIDREIITLKYSSDATFIDIGEIMGMTEGAVKRRYYKIRYSFKKYYEREQREKEV